MKAGDTISVQFHSDQKWHDAKISSVLPRNGKYTAVAIIGPSLHVDGKSVLWGFTGSGSVVGFPLTDICNKGSVSCYGDIFDVEFKDGCVLGCECLGKIRDLSTPFTSEWDAACYHFRHNDYVIGWEFDSDDD